MNYDANYFKNLYEKTGLSYSEFGKVFKFANSEATLKVNTYNKIVGHKKLSSRDIAICIIIEYLLQKNLFDDFYKQKIENRERRK